MRLAAIWLTLTVSCHVASTEITRPDGGPDASPCGTCDVTELCIEQDAAACLPICANGLHCWSACCVALPNDSGYNVCMSADVCFGGVK